MSDDGRIRATLKAVDELEAAAEPRGSNRAQPDTPIRTARNERLGRIALAATAVGVVIVVGVLARSPAAQLIPAGSAAGTARPDALAAPTRSATVPGTERTAATSAPPVADRSHEPIAVVSGTWAPIASAPVAGRVGRAAVWTGQEVVVWGGGVAAGAAYDPGTGTWRRLPTAPIAPRSDAVSVWTGAEVLFWGGTSGRALTDGAAYDPIRNRWRKMAATTLLDGSPAVGAWSGHELLVVTGTLRTAAYDPTTDGWRQLAAPPLPEGQLQAGWVGDEMVVLGVGDGGPNPVRAAALDPATGSWRSLADAPLTGLDLGEAAVSTGDRLVTATGIYDPTTDRWEMATGCQGFTTTTAVWTGQVVLTPTIALDPYNGRCLPLPAPSKGLRTVAIREFPWFAWTGRSLVLWSGVIGDQVSPPNDGASVTPV